MKANTRTAPTKVIKVDMLARVEGEGALYVKVKNRIVTDVEFRIFEPPRLFEALLRGRAYTEAPDITARICGICPVAYQMSAVSAMENALGIPVEDGVRALRRLLYCGEWIESHVLHIYMLHAPDFLGYPDAIQMARDYPEIVKRALALKKVGNDIVRVLGGREIHPINVRVGGFYHFPTKSELAALLDPVKVGTRCGFRNRALDCDPVDSRSRSQLRIRRTAPSRRIPNDRRSPDLQPRVKYRHSRVRGSLC
jgi:coenzyme F420-reducing hydrogenase alpha subunit